MIFLLICIHPSSEGAIIKRQNDAGWFTGGRTGVMQQHREQRRQNTIGGYILNQSFAVMSFPFMSLSQRSEEEADPSIFRTLLQHKSIFSTTKAPPQTEPFFILASLWSNSKGLRVTSVFQKHVIKRFDETVALRFTSFVSSSLVWCQLYHHTVWPSLSV